jgi:excisionase family DNA binding protein
MSNEMAELRLVSKSEAAKLLGIGKDKLNELLETGKIRFLFFDYRIRIPLREINKFIEDNLTSMSSDNNTGKIIIDSTPIQDKSDFNSQDYFNQLIQGE